MLAIEERVRRGNSSRHPRLAPSQLRDAQRFTLA
jgi:hypothetical protein